MLFSSSDSDSDTDDWDDKEDEASGNPVRILIDQSVRVAIAVQSCVSYFKIVEDLVIRKCLHDNELSTSRFKVTVYWFLQLHSRQIVLINIQLFRERLLEKMCTRQSREVIWDMINTLFLTLELSNLL